MDGSGKKDGGTYRIQNHVLVLGRSVSEIKTNTDAVIECGAATQLLLGTNSILLSDQEEGCLTAEQNGVSAVFERSAPDDTDWAKKIGKTAEPTASEDAFLGDWEIAAASYQDRVLAASILDLGGQLSILDNQTAVFTMRDSGAEAGSFQMSWKLDKDQLVLENTNDTDNIGRFLDPDCLTLSLTDTGMLADTDTGNTDATAIYFLRSKEESK